MTTKELIEILSKDEFSNGADTEIVIVDNKNREFVIDNIQLTMGGQFHNVLLLKEIEEPKNKWFKETKYLIEELEEQLKIYEDVNFQKKWIKKTKSKDINKLLKLISITKERIKELKGL